MLLSFIHLLNYYILHSEITIEINWNRKPHNFDIYNCKLYTFALIKESESKLMRTTEEKNEQVVRHHDMHISVHDFLNESIFVVVVE